MQRILIKTFFLFTVGKCLSRKAVHNWVTNVSLMTKRLKRRCGSGTGKAMGQMYQCWWRIYREVNVFFRFEYHLFYVLYSFLTYLLTLLRLCVVSDITAVDITSQLSRASTLGNHPVGRTEENWKTIM
jgi:hypothetical protein